MLPGTKWHQDSQSAYRSTSLIYEDTVIRAVRPTEIATSITRSAITRSARWPWTKSRRCVILGTSNSLWLPTIGALASPIGCVSIFPKSVKKVCLMDIAPTLTMYRRTNQEFATKYMWWFFLIQAAPLPEHLIGLDPQYYLQTILSGLNKTPGAITPEALSEYRRCFYCTSTIHGGCEDMRASADIGLEMDGADDCAGNKIVAPVHALWGANNTVGQSWDVLATWRAKATSTVTGRSLDCGHFLQEERPEETIEELQRFFGTV